MSLATVYTAKARKEWTCGSCGVAIQKGETRVTFTVGFRGRTQTRCGKTECYPSRSTRESSLLSGAYAAIDGADLTGASTLEDIQAVMDEVAAGIQEVADEYSNSEMFEMNYDLQERAELCESAVSEIESWSPDEDEPATEPVDCDECGGSGQVKSGDGAEEEDCEECDATGSVDPDEDAHDKFMAAARDSAQEVLDSLEI